MTPQEHLERAEALLEIAEKVGLDVLRRAQTHAALAGMKLSIETLEKASMRWIRVSGAYVHPPCASIGMPGTPMLCNCGDEAAWRELYFNE